MLVGMFMLLVAGQPSFGNHKITKGIRFLLRITGSIVTTWGIISLSSFFGGRILHNLEPVLPGLTENWPTIVLWTLIYIILPTVLILLVTRFIIVAWKNRQYKLGTIPVVIRRDSDTPIACIQAENTGIGEYTCVAKLMEVVYLDSEAKEENEIDLNMLNPKGLYLGWSSNLLPNMRLIESVPKTIRLITTDLGDYIDDATTRIVYQGREYSPPLQPGTYRIRVGLFRLIVEGRKQKEMDTIECRLSIVVTYNTDNIGFHITSYQLNWLDD